jgi:hypothetical protein
MPSEPRASRTQPPCHKIKNATNPCHKLNNKMEPKAIALLSLGGLTSGPMLSIKNALAKVMKCERTYYFQWTKFFKNTPNFISNTICKTNTNVPTFKIATLPLCWRKIWGTLLSRFGGLRLTAPLRTLWNTFNSNKPFGTSTIDNEVVSWK